MRLSGVADYSTICLTALCLGLLALCAPLRGQSDYPLPDIPDSIADEALRADYATARYWDAYDFRDTTLLRPDYAEQALASFLALLPYATATGRTAAIDRWIASAEPFPATLNYFSAQAEEYLQDPRSPLRNDDLYIELLRRLTVSPTADETLCTRWQGQLAQLSRNRVGDVATDFRYLTPDGREASLLQTLPVQGGSPGQGRLLLFYDPECPECHALIRRLRDLSALASAVRAGRMEVMAIDTSGDEALWRQQLPDLPSQWHPVLDLSDVRGLGLYHLPSLPALYVLDASGRVLLRDASVPRLLAFLLAPQ